MSLRSASKLVPDRLRFALALLSCGALGCSPGRETAPSPGAESRAVETVEPALADVPQTFGSIAERFAVGEYRFRPGRAGFSAKNRSQNLTLELDGKRAHVATPDASSEVGFSIELASWGRAGKPRAAAAAAPVLGACTADGRVDEEGSCLKRVELRRRELVEWWENRKEGLEQGFTVAEREPGTGPLHLELRIRGARATIEPGASDALLVTEAGASLRYGALRAFDADETPVPARFVASHGGLAIEVSDEHARYPLVVDPIITTSSYTAESNQSLAEFGISVAGAGDVNRDGFGDIVVGAWLYDNGQTDEGRAYLYLGSATGPAATPAWTAEINQDGAGFGRAVASAGDVNGDGYSDVIVGAPNYTNGQVQEGAVFLYLGSASGLSLSAAWTAEGEQTGAQFGLALSSAGDVNRDGRSDVIIGAPYFDNPQIDEGAAKLYFGTASGLAASAAWTGESDQAGAYYGSAVAGAGDINRDGYSDIVVGAPYYDNGNTDEGRTYSFHGSPTGLIATAWSVEGEFNAAYLGAAIAGAGDVNGDGYADVIVGAPNYSSGVVSAGQATVYHGSAMGLSSTFNWRYTQNQTGGLTGTSVASAGDVNGDGFSDVIVGTSHAGFPEVGEGRAAIFVGSPTGLGMTPQTVESNQANAAFGRSVASAGDVDGDGYSDVVAGAPNFDNMQNDEGRIFVFRGAASLMITTGPAITTTASLPNVRDAGDVNGDGFGDVLVGSSGSGGTVLLHLGSDVGLAATVSWSTTGTVSAPIASSAGAGDVNGDGYTDVIVGQPAFANGEATEGRAMVFYGSPSGPSLTADWVVEGNIATARFGTSVFGAGDVNGDGYGDVIVGAPNFGNVEGLEGRAYVFLGSASGLSTTAAWTVESNVTNANFGGAVSGAGDVNHDGFADFLVGAPGAGVGRAYLFGGGASLSTTPIQFVTFGANFGSLVGRGGDINGDGYADVLVGSGTQVIIYLGSATGISSLATWSVTTAATAGDVNGDGFGDLIYFSAAVSTGVNLGSPTGIGSSAFSTPWSTGGVTVTSADVNGDGYSDAVYGNANPGGGGPYIFARFGNTVDSGASAFPLAPLARRTSTTTPIASGGLALTGAFDGRLLGRTPFGRGRLKVAVEVEPFGTPFDGVGVVSGSAWTDTGAAGIDLQQAVSGLGENTAYHWRSRLAYDPANGFPQGWSRWLYGGTLGERKGVHLRTVCAAGDSDGDGTPNCNDGCPSDPNKVAPGACGCGTADTDSDSDGTPNCNDGCPSDPNKIAAGGCGCGTADTDSDGDGTPNCIDGCPNNAPKTSPGACGCATPDTDSDGDGTPNCIDGCPNNAPKTSPGVCGCTTPDTDSDGDGTPNCNDGCPNNPAKTTPGVCGCSAPDTDTDSDGTADCAELCDNDPNKTAPGVCGCGTPDADGDGDGTLNCQDGCPTDPNKISAGACGCGLPDTDSDGDGTANCNDGCPMNPAKITPGACGCSVPDTDSDGDGTPNCIDTCPNDPGKTAPGVCGCGVSDADTDGDGTLNCNDGCPSDPNKTAAGVCGCGISDADTDGDGARNCNDGCPNDPAKTAPGVCGCGTSDADGDSDGTPNCHDGCAADPTKIAPGVCGCGNADTDTDADGTPNCTDGCPSDPNKTSAGTCGCGQPEATNCGDDCPADPNKTAPGVCGCGTPDTDTDSDGTPNCNDNCPSDPGKTAPGVCGCGDADTDTDSDMTPNCTDGCPSDPGKTMAGVCGCGTADTDSDSDMTPNCNDDCPTDPGKIAPGVCGCGTSDADTDGDGTMNCDDDCPSDALKVVPGACGCGILDADSDSDGVPNCDDACPDEAASTSDGCPGGGGEGGQGGEGGEGGSGAEAGAGAGGQGQGGSSAGAGNAGESGAGGDDGEAGAGQGGSTAGTSGSGGAGQAGSATTGGTGGKKSGGGHSDDDSGCGCHVPGRSTSSGAAWRALLALLALSVFVRRRHWA